MNDELLKKYARLAVEMGVNLKENDTLCINTPIETAEFARFIAEAAYAVGAKDVIVNYSDAKLNKIRLLNSSVDTLSTLPEWFGENLTITLEMVHVLFLSLHLILMHLAEYLWKI